jgi:hypothetical protein
VYGKVLYASLIEHPGNNNKTTDTGLSFQYQRRFSGLFNAAAGGCKLTGAPGTGVHQTIDNRQNSSIIRLGKADVSWHG